MQNGYKRKKQPELVRERVLTAAIEEVAGGGLNILSIGAVARRAGVTKGGLLHHFPSKRILIEAMYLNLLSSYEKRLAEIMAADPEPRGRFTRAYLLAATESSTDHPGAKVASLATMAMSTDLTLNEQWRQWLRAQLLRHGEAPESTPGHLVRLAADGLWMEIFFSEAEGRASRAAVMARLLEMTYTI